MSAFEALGVMPELVQAVEAMDWTLPTDVQDEAIPLILGGGDVMIAAETGSGKTGAFALPILQIIYEAIRGEADITGSKAVSKKNAAGGGVNEQKGGARLNVVMSPGDRDPVFAISPDGLKCQAREMNDWAGGRANIGVFQGKYYFEATVADEGLCRVGWATANSTRNLGTDRLSFGYGGTGKKSHGNQFNDYGEPFGLNDTIGCFVDFDNRTISYSKNGRPLGVAFTIPPELRGQPLYPAVVLKNAEMHFNFGQDKFKYPPPPGYISICDARRENTSLAIAKPRRPATKKSLLAIILEPTRELAQQVYDEISKFKVFLKDPEITHELFIGGVETNTMMQALRDGVNIVIGTPGRLVDFIKSGKMDVSAVRCFVMDEADSLIEMGQRKDIEAIYERLPKDKGMQVIICSATLHSPEISELADKICVNPTWVDLKGKDSVPDTVDHAVILADPVADQSWKREHNKIPHDGIHRGINIHGNNADVYSYGIKLLKMQILLQLIDEFKMDQCMIFCRTQVDCDNLEEFLTQQGGGRKFQGKAESGKENPYSCVVLHSGRDQKERQANLEAFKEGDVRFLISTDVGARGLDIKELPYVINMTLPDKPEQYIHRIGRVGRAGCPGLAISIVATQKERVWWHTCNRRDRGRGCTNTKLKDDGGCTIWYDEQDLLKQIEARLQGVKVPVLDRANLAKGKDHIINAAAKGRAAEIAAIEATKKKVAEILPAWKELSELEAEAQKSFLRLNNRPPWATGSAPASGSGRGGKGGNASKPPLTNSSKPR